MCNSIGGGAAAKALPATPATPPALPPARPPVGGGCGSPTQYAPDATQVGGLQGQLEQGLRQLQALGLQTGPLANPAQFTPGQLAGGGPAGAMTSFQRTHAHRFDIALMPVTDGASAIENLRRLAGAHGERVRLLSNAIEQDARQYGTRNPVDIQMFALERERSAQLDAMLERLRPLAPTIDASEGTALMKLVRDSNTTGMLEPAELARVMLNIQGSAANLPASYLASANRAQDFAASIDARIAQLSNATANAANQTGSFDVAQLRQVEQLTADRARLSDALRRNFDLAHANPSDAQSKLDRALQSTDLATVIAALA